MEQTSVVPAKKPFKWHYAWIVVAVTFVALLASSGVRNMPAVLIKPLNGEFGWDTASISLPIGISLLFFGLGAPLGGSLVERLGPTRVLYLGLALIVTGLTPLIWLNALWQLYIFWGVVTGIGTGMVTNVVGATIAYRWFESQRGLVLGLLAAASAAGQLAFFPLMTTATVAVGWRTMIVIVAIICAVLIIPVFLFMSDRPSDKGLEPYGAEEASPVEKKASETATRKMPLSQAIRTRDFWLLAGSFFICGYTTNGLIGTHLLSHAVEHGFSAVATSGAIGLMGVMNVAGTLASGWLSDRYDNRKLLAIYYTFRAISISALPFILDFNFLLLFAVVYGLDWIATVPPTINLAAARFGRASLGSIYGWIFCSHMIGAGVAAYAGGFFRDLLGNYHLIFLSGTVWGLVAALLALNISSPRRMAKLVAEPA